LAHLHQGGDYYLTDVVEFFGLGRVAIDPPQPVVAFDRAALRRLKAEADAQSFDFPEPFIEMCLELTRAAHLLPGTELRFIERFPPLTAPDPTRDLFSSP